MLSYRHQIIEMIEHNLAVHRLVKMQHQRRVIRSLHRTFNISRAIRKQHEIIEIVLP